MRSDQIDIAMAAGELDIDPDLAGSRNGDGKERPRVGEIEEQATC